MYVRLAGLIVGITFVCVVVDTWITAAYQPLMSEAAVAQHGWPLVPAATLGSAAMGALIISRYPRHPIGWLLCTAGLTSISLAAETYSLWVLDHGGPGSDDLGHVAAWVSALLGAPIALTSLTFVFLLAPDGHLSSRRWRYAAGASLLGLASYTAGIVSATPGRMTVNGDEEYGIVTSLLTSFGVVLIGLTLIASVVSLVRRTRRERGKVRLQLRWIAASAAFVAGGFAFLLIAGSIQGEQTFLVSTPLFLAYFTLPIAVAVAVLRYRLFDIDLIINRAVLLTVATALVAAGYVVLVVVVGGNAGGFWPSLLATAVVALAFQPLRTRVVRFADRLAFGRRAAPYDALADFSRRLGESPDPTTLLPAVADAAVAAVSAQRATVRLGIDTGADLTATWPPGAADIDDTADVVRLAVVDRGEELGDLSVQTLPGRMVRPHDLRLLRGLADQAAIAFRNIRLSTELSARVQELARNTAELDESRRRLIEARDRERSRIERAIARDVMPHLDPLPDQLARLARAGDPTGDPTGDPAPAHPLEPLVSAATTALEALREITRGVFPAQLARGGLGPALTSQLGRSPGHGHVMIDQTAAGRRFDWRVEAAAYFCFVEAVRDLAPPLEVALAVPDGHLLLTLTGGPASGPTLANMRDRVEAVGGSVHEHLIADRCVIQVSLLVPAVTPSTQPLPGPAPRVAG